MVVRTPNVFTIAPGLSFARVLVEGTIARVGRDPLRLADVRIFVPTRRAVRSLQDAFAVGLGGAALGPDISPLGDIGEDESAFDPYTEELEGPPAIAPLRRRLLLAQLVEHWSARQSRPLPFAQAAAQAGELAGFLDEALTHGADLATLKTLAPAEFAEHWQKIADFLAIIAEHWPNILKDEGGSEMMTRRDAALHALARRLQGAPSDAPVIAAGSTGSIPATAALLKTIAHLPAGSVVLPALDTHLDAESWNALQAGHGQFGLKQLLQHIGAERGDVSPWYETSLTRMEKRVHFLSEALRPPPTTEAWRNIAAETREGWEPAFVGLTRIDAENAREEALVIAIAMRETLETPGHTAALVTPDRGLARRVRAELRRWNITADDSAGTPLARTPPGSFLILLARAATEDFAPIPLLALLKHPLASGGMERSAFLRNVRLLEEKVLRGLRPHAGLAGLSKALEHSKAPESLRSWWRTLAECFSPLETASKMKGQSIAAILRTHAQLAEALCATDKDTRRQTLWKGEAGEACAYLVSELERDGSDVILADASHYADFFQDLCEMRVVRPAYGTHPRIAILGPLEARLLQHDLTILGGLNEGVWPAEAATDPWLSRPMREKLGLESPERRIGLAAHDFFSLAAAPTVLLTRAKKQDGAPTVPSRWLLRIEQLARGLEKQEKLKARNDLLAWARALDQAPPAAHAKRPAPKPPVATRPRKLSVTEIETWLRDPYAIYAKHVLKLRPLDPVDMEPGPAERGTAIHNALERFLLERENEPPEQALQMLLQIGEDMFREAGASPAHFALWRPRFARAARWFLEWETERRKTTAESYVEKDGVLELPGPGRAFHLKARADRIDRLQTGAAAIIDYKTGGVPTTNQIKAFLAPQLPLEAAMLMAGVFTDVPPMETDQLIYLRLTGGIPPGEERVLPLTVSGEEALARLKTYIARYDNEAAAYPSRFAPARSTDTGDYDHLARVREWEVGEREGT